jgi:hypothetical protein
MKMLQNCNNGTNPDNDQLQVITVDSDQLPQQLCINDLPPAIAALSRKEQLYLVCLASNMRVSDIATLCNCTTQNVSEFIRYHDLRKWVSAITPALVQQFRATRWQIMEQAALTRAMQGVDSASPMQAVTMAAIATDKQAAILPPAQREGEGPGELEAQLTIRFKRKT